MFIQQFMSFISRVVQKRFGFWCWKLFTINYFRSYEVINAFLDYMKSNKKVKE
jgi:hypothetical protein